MRWLRAYVTMLPRLQAEESLNAAQISLLPHLKADKRGHSKDRERIMRGWQQLAIGPMQSNEYDSHGRRSLKGSGQVRRWLNEWFGEAGLPRV